MSSERNRRYEAWNEVCDADALWGPLLFLRPAQDQKFTRLRLLVVVTSFGSFYGLSGAFVLRFLHHLTNFRVPHGAVLPLALSATAYLCGELTFLRAWNERARLMLRRESWLERQNRESDGSPRLDPK
ncbi:MAG TPA: hypothetical protein VNN72_29995 [Polyangiaceae bacterium]|nr:hypothetical protein [Polyangiaceae bacterium]